MNKSKFVQTEGYPLTAERLQELQSSFQIFNAFGSLAGDLTIISGCETIGNTVKNGTITIKGELLEFREAEISAESTVIIYEENISKPFKNGTVKEVYTIRYASIGTGEISWRWEEFKKLDPIAVLMSRMAILEKKAAVFQAGGGMVLWNKPANKIPSGWREVVEWKGRIPVGLDPEQSEFNVMGKMEGSKDAVVVSHSHTIINSGNVNNGLTGGTVTNKTARWDSGSGSLLNGTISTEGVSGVGKNLQPYRVVLFIEFIG